MARDPGWKGSGTAWGDQEDWQWHFDEHLAG